MCAMVFALRQQHAAVKAEMLRDEAAEATELLKGGTTEAPTVLLQKKMRKPKRS